LVVEDEPWIRLALVHHLEQSGFDVLEAGSVAEATSILERTAGIDLVFTDLRLPGEGDGIELARWMAKNRPGAPVVLTSGEIARMPGLKELCRAEGFTYLAKPYPHAQVSARILELIERRKRRDA
jgi:DNA-binding NtrC family response regulator